MSNFGSLFLDEKIHDATFNTADALGISSEIVWKDYAVFGVLKALFEDSPKDISNRLVFKGVPYPWGSIYLPLLPIF